jgi:hypothetical protein
VTTDRFIERQSWNRFDKLWALGGVLFYGAPCWALLIASLVSGSLRVALACASALAIFGVFNWRMRARTAGVLLAEVTPHGIRFRDDQEPIAWADVARVDFYETGGGTHSPTHDHITLHLRNGSAVTHTLQGVLRFQLEVVVPRLAPQVPLGHERPTPRR